MGIYNIESSFPESTDDLYFISDVNLETQDIYKHHKQLVSNGKYSEASEYLNQQTGITPVRSGRYFQITYLGVRPKNIIKQKNIIYKFIQRKDDKK